MADLDVPEEFDEWPFEVRRFVLAEANQRQEIRQEIDDIIGLSRDWQKNPLHFTKIEAAAIVIALGGPDA